MFINPTETSLVHDEGVRRRTTGRFLPIRKGRYRKRKKEDWEEGPGGWLSLKWLGDRDSNPNSLIQSQMSYH
jgi:hypothetical protein